MISLRYRTFAAVLCGEGEVWRNGVRLGAAQALTEAGMTPLRLRPKEGLAIMNGTSVMTGLACLAYARADYLTRLVTRITAWRPLRLTATRTILMLSYSQ